MASRAVCAVGEKGLRTILRASYEKQEDDIYERLMILKETSKVVHFIFTTTVAEGLLTYERNHFPRRKK